ncbi:hypothetical protein RCL1_008396 [Eukaryota sp. TZLM3-RCL]
MSSPPIKKSRSCPTGSVKIPRSLLSTSFLNLLKSRILPCEKNGSEQLQLNLKSLMRFLTHFGSVSASFRSCFFDVLKCHFSTVLFEFDIHKHSSVLLLLSNCIPDLLFSIDCGEASPLFSSLHINSLSFCPTLFYSIEDQVNVLSSVYYSNSVTRLVLQDCLSEPLLTSIVELFPHLRSLKIPSVDDSDSFTFPTCLSGLTSLVISCDECPELDVSNLVNLCHLDATCEYYFSSTLIGLDTLVNLKHLKLKRFLLRDSVNDNILLENLVLDSLPKEAISILFANENVFVNCHISIINCDVSDFNSTIGAKSRLVSYKYTHPSPISPPHFSTIDSPLLQDLEATCDRCPVSIELINCHKLKSLKLIKYMNSNNLLSLSLASIITNPNHNPSSFQLLSLVCDNIEFDLLLSLLPHCLYLKELTLRFIKFNSAASSLVIQTSFSYLRSLKLLQTSGFLSQVRVFPKLKTLEISHINDFDISILNSKYPVLEVLSLNCCRTDKQLLNPNYTVKRLCIDYHLESTLDLHYFLVAEYLDLTIPHSINQPIVIFPSNICVLDIHVSFHLLKLALSSLNNLLALGGEVYCDDDTSQQVQMILPEKLSCSLIVVSESERFSLNQ